jgi:hypothetical protein
VVLQVNRGLVVHLQCTRVGAEAHDAVVVQGIGMHRDSNALTDVELFADQGLLRCHGRMDVENKVAAGWIYVVAELDRNGDSDHLQL